MENQKQPPEQTKTGIKERITRLIEALGKNRSSFASSINKPRNTVKIITDGKSKPGFEITEAILFRYPQVNADWLMKGEGPMFRAEEKTSRGDEYLMKYVAELEATVSDLRRINGALLEQRGGLPGKAEGVPLSQNLPSELWVETPFFSTFGVQIGVHSES